MRSLLTVAATLSSCSSSDLTCPGRACPDPIAITVHLPGARAETRQVTFCKAATCASGSLGPSQGGLVVDGELPVAMGTQPSASGQVVAVTVPYPMDAVDGETLSLLIEDDAGSVILDWSAPVTYTRTPLACSSGCVSFRTDLTGTP